jgi:hypothetical protein
LATPGVLFCPGGDPVCPGKSVLILVELAIFKSPALRGLRRAEISRK